MLISSKYIAGSVGKVPPMACQKVVLAIPFSSFIVLHTHTHTHTQTFLQFINVVTYNWSEAYNSALKIALPMMPSLSVVCKTIKEEEGLAKTTFQHQYLALT